MHLYIHAHTLTWTFTLTKTSSNLWNTICYGKFCFHLSPPSTYYFSFLQIKANQVIHFFLSLTFHRMHFHYVPPPPAPSHPPHPRTHPTPCFLFKNQNKAIRHKYQNKAKISQKIKTMESSLCCPTPGYGACPGLQLAHPVRLPWRKLLFSSQQVATTDSFLVWDGTMYTSSSRYRDFVYFVCAVITSVSSYVCNPCCVGRMLFI